MELGEDNIERILEYSKVNEELQDNIDNYFKRLYTKKNPDETENKYKKGNLQHAEHLVKNTKQMHKRFTIRYIDEVSSEHMKTNLDSWKNILKYIYQDKINDISYEKSIELIVLRLPYTEYSWFFKFENIINNSGDDKLNFVQFSKLLKGTYKLIDKETKDGTKNLVLIQKNKYLIDLYLIKYLLFLGIEDEEKQNEINDFKVVQMINIIIEKQYYDINEDIHKYLEKQWDELDGKQKIEYQNIFERRKAKIRKAKNYKDFTMYSLLIHDYKKHIKVNNKEQLLVSNVQKELKNKNEKFLENSRLKYADKFNTEEIFINIKYLLNNERPVKPLGYYRQFVLDYKKHFNKKINYNTGKQLWKCVPDELKSRYIMKYKRLSLVYSYLKIRLLKLKKKYKIRKSFSAYNEFLHQMKLKSKGKKLDLSKMHDKYINLPADKKNKYIKIAKNKHDNLVKKVTRKNYNHIGKPNIITKICMIFYMIRKMVIYYLTKTK